MAIDLGWGPITKTIGEVFAKQPSRDAPNPFRRDESGAIPSVLEISRAIRDNPVRAKALCIQAGENPNSWMPENPK